MKQLSFCHLPFLLRNEEVTGTPARGWRWSHQDLICLTYLLFFYMNGCIATPVVKRAPVNLWDLGSSPSGTHFVFLHIFHFLTFLQGAWAFGPFCVFFTNEPPCLLMHPWPNLFYFLYFIYFIFLIIFH